MLAADIGHLRTGVSHAFTSSLVPEIVANFTRRHPGISLLIINTSGPAIRNGVASGRFDLGLSYAETGAREVDLETLLDDELVIVCPSGHAFAGRGPIRFDDLQGESLILPDIDCTSRRRLDQVLDEREVNPRIMLEINDMHTILETVRRGPYASIMGRRTVIATEGIEMIPLIEPSVTMPIAMVWPSGNSRTSAMVGFRTFMLQIDQLRSHPGGRPG